MGAGAGASGRTRTTPRPSLRRGGTAVFWSGGFAGAPLWAFGGRAEAWNCERIKDAHYDKIYGEPGAGVTAEEWNWYLRKCN